MQMTNSEKKWVVTLFAYIVMTLVFLSTGCASATATATPPEEAWSKTFGGTNPDWAEAVQQTSDGGYILVGTTQYAADNTNVWLLKVNSDGNEQWNRIISEAGCSLIATCIQETSDGGYIIAGEREPDGKEKCLFFYKKVVRLLVHEYRLRPPVNVFYLLQVDLSCTQNLRLSSLMDGFSLP